MSLSFVLGASGSGKSNYIYNKIINESIMNPQTNYIILVPEQYSMALQRKMVMLHPAGGSMNIDVIGFNRLSYRIFDELNVKPGVVLEDYGKTMLIRQVAGEIADKLKVYGNSLDKSGFIDEVKSLMSELYQYNLNAGMLEEVVTSLGEDDAVLRDKLADMLLIFKAFEDRLGEDYIVAEQLSDLLYSHIGESKLIKNSVICLEGFTGFTPIQLKCIGELMRVAKKMYVVLTIDRYFYEKKNVSEHELFFLTRQTIYDLKKVAESNSVTVEPDVFIENDSKNRWNNGSGTNAELTHLEKNIFRYPYKAYVDEANNISVTSYDNPRKELMGIASQIKRLVVDEGYRYKDIAVISGEMENIIGYVEQLFPMYDIPYFLDYSRTVKNNRYIDALLHFLRMNEDNFSYDSVFAFLKSGVIPDLEDDEIELLENYCLSKGVRGFSRWNNKWECEVEDTRAYIMECIGEFCLDLKKKKITIKDYTEIIRRFMDKISFLDGINDERLYQKIISILDKMEEIMGSKNVNISEFSELIDLGLKDISLGMIPGRLDMITIGDITRTRLEDIKVLFIIGVNDGVIPKKSTPAQIISDREKERLRELSFNLAPTEKFNSFIEQFYLYINMTKPSDKLFISYTTMNGENEVLRPSYLISRILNLYKKLSVKAGKKSDSFIGTINSEVETLIEGIQEIMTGDSTNFDRTMKLYKSYIEMGRYEIVEKIMSGLAYSNIPDKLDSQVSDLLRLTLMSQSVSRLETYAKCAYRYFLKYVLKLKEREIGQINDRHIGNILHSALERLYRYVYDNMSNDWSLVDDNKRDELIEKFVYDAFDAECISSRDIDERYDYIKSMLVRVGKRSALVLSGITKKDNYQPNCFEYRFDTDIRLGSEDRVINLKGIVDRADINFSKETNQIYLRIIDYKSGEHDFKINRLYEGLELQLAVYMNIMLELTGNRYKDEGKDVKVVPAGMYYYRMNDPFVKISKLDEIEKKRDAKLKLDGYTNEDAETFRCITDFAMEKVKDIAGDIMDGKIDKKPFKQGNKDSCEHCEFKAVCRFDTKNGGNSYRYPRYKDRDNDAVMAKIKERLGGEDRGMDTKARKDN